VQIGRLNINNLTSEDKKALEDIKAATPTNLFIQETYVADESVFNEIITLADVIFAVYKDFYRSSNMLSKAAYFEKPILVAHQCLMGERVARYGIGLAVAPNDSDAIHQALVAAPQLPKLSEHFAAYRKDFNQQALQNKLISFVQACLLKESSTPLLPSSTSPS
jgi:glycosyltransferase involved in cell wall biosynthesis